MYRIKVVHIKGKSNVLADTLSRLISIDPDVKLEPELEGHEFWTVLLWGVTQSIELHTVNEIITGHSHWSPWCRYHRTCYYIHHTLAQFQNMWNYKNLMKKLHLLHPRIEKGHLADSGYFIDKEGNLLWWRISDNLQEFKPVVLPNSLISTALLLAHDHTSHNGFQENLCSTQVVVLLERDEKRMCSCTASIVKCVQSRRLRKTKFFKDNFRPGSMPMEFISMDLVGRTIQGLQWPQNMPSQLSVCWLATCSVFPWRPKQQRRLWTNTSPV